MPQKAAYKRKQYIVAPQFQLRYVGLILMLVFLTGILCAYVVYYTSMILLGDKLANVYPQGRLISTVNMVNMRILLSLILITPLVVVICIYASHKIAGPIYRIERHLAEMVSGNLSSHLILRQGDEFMGLAVRINTLSESMRLAILNQKSSMEKINLELEMLKAIADCKPGETPKIDSNIDRLNNEVRVLTKELGKYKV